jgi:hypothetical protein
VEVGSPSSVAIWVISVSFHVMFYCQDGVCVSISGRISVLLVHSYK